MARSAVLTLAVSLGLCTGCFVLDEIDQGREVMKRHSGQNPGARQAAPAAVADPVEDEGPGLFARVQAFLQEQREGFAPERDPSDEIVTCELEDGLTFTYASDCRSHGGKIR
jgi:hypothetical protein